eukprot:2765737-Heterocapsa_arctica.AAC.1
MNSAFVYLTCGGIVQAFLADDANLVMNFFAENGVIGGAGKAFWQAWGSPEGQSSTPREALGSGPN